VTISGVKCVSGMVWNKASVVNGFLLCILLVVDIVLVDMMMRMWDEQDDGWQYSDAVVAITIVMMNENLSVMP